MCKKNAVSVSRFSLSRNSYSKENINTKINATLVELGFESNYNNINSDWHVYKTYNSNIRVCDNVIEFLDFIEADINVYETPDTYEIEIQQFAGNISEIELFVRIKSAFLEITKEQTSFAKHIFLYMIMIKKIIISVLTFIGCFI
jgi:hypothetical protein